MLVAREVSYYSGYGSKGSVAAVVGVFSTYDGAWEVAIHGDVLFDAVLVTAFQRRTVA